MQTEPLEIDGIAGPIVVKINTFTGKHSIVAGREELVNKRGWYVLPRTDGSVVEARLRSSFLDTYPTLEIEGVKYRTGPAVPLGLKMVALLPILLLSAGCLGGLLAGIAITANLAITRGQLHTAVKAVMMVGVLLVAYVLLVIIAAAVQQNLPPTK